MSALRVCACLSTLLQVLDSRRKFLEAALRYLEVLSVGGDAIEEGELLVGYVCGGWRSQCY